MAQDSRQYCDGYWSGPDGDVLVTFRRTNNARDVRDALIGLAYALDQEPPSSHGMCLLVTARLTTQRLQGEMQMFRRIVRPDLAERIALTTVDTRGNIVGSVASSGLNDYLRGLAQQELTSAFSRVNRESVKAHVIEQWLKGQNLESQAQIARRTKASAPTVAAALHDLEQQGLLHTGQQGLMLQEPSWDAWRRLAEAYASKRSSIRYTDHSGLARKPMEMAKRLGDLQQKGQALSVTVGGVIGAAHHYPDLDITAPARLDLHVGGSDLQFLRKIDAGLVPTIDTKAKTILVIHRAGSQTEAVDSADRLKIAAPIDCLADLIEMGLMAEAQDFAMALNRQAKANSVTANQSEPDHVTY